MKSVGIFSRVFTCLEQKVKVSSSGSFTFTKFLDFRSHARSCRSDKIHRTFQIQSDISGLMNIEVMQCKLIKHLFISCCECYKSIYLQKASCLIDRQKSRKQTKGEKSQRSALISFSQFVHATMSQLSHTLPLRVHCYVQQHDQDNAIDLWS